MRKVYAMMASGTEEAELLNVTDVLTRAGFEVSLVSINSSKEIISSHNVHIKADLCIDEVSFDDADVLFLPGGMPGSVNLSNCSKLIEGIRKVLDKGGLVSAICAAPQVVLEQHGFLKGLSYTCYPGFEKYATSDAKHINEGVVETSQIITGRALGSAIDLGLAIVKKLLGEAKMLEVKKAIQY